MKSKILIIAFSLFLTAGLKAQVTISGADTLMCGTLCTTLTANLTGDIPTDAGLPADDIYSVVHPIGFTFNFYGTNYTGILIGSNGNLCFDATLAGAYDPYSITGPLLGNTSVLNCICGPWCDIDYFDYGGTCTYSTDGVAPFRKFVVTFCHDFMFTDVLCPGEWTQSQVIIYETTNRIEVHIGHKTVCTAWNGGYAICGVQNAAGTAATVAPGRDMTPTWSATNEAWRFTPVGGGASYSVSSIPYAPIPYSTSLIYWYDSTTNAYLGTGTTKTFCPTSTTTYKAGALGCSDTSFGYLRVYVLPCGILTTSNNPCPGDSIKLWCHGDSLGATYLWTGPASFTSTSQMPYRFPTSYSDTGLYRVVRFLSGVYDTGYVYVHFNWKPTLTLTSNSPFCQNTVDTLQLFATADTSIYTINWSGPVGFSSTIVNPIRPGFTAIDTGIYTAIVSTYFGCKDTADVHVSVNTVPPAPIISGTTNYCIGQAFVPFVVTGLVSGGSPLWYSTASGGTGSTVYPTVNTSVVGCTTFWASQVNPCEGPRDSITVCVHPNPQVPTLSTSPICADSMLYLFSTDTSSGITYHWSGPASFSSGVPNPTIPNAQLTNSGSYILTVTDPAYNCAASASIVVTINPTPAIPHDSANAPCENGTLSLYAYGSGAGSIYYWTGPALFSSSLSNPTIIPATIGVNDGVYTVMAIIGNCPSLPTTLVANIHPIPPVPVVKDSVYCQQALAVPLFAIGDSGSTLKWYTTATGGTGTTIPPLPTTTVVGTTTWYVDQTQFGCTGPRVAETVTILYLPQPAIALSKPFVCADSAITLRYSGGNMISPAFTWTLPWGTHLVSGTLNDTVISVRFDSTYNNYVYLHASDYNNRCSHDTSVFVKVVPRPTTNLFIYPNVCAGDTVVVALTARDTSAYEFLWNFDNANIITANSNSGGPYGITWTDKGTKIVTVTPMTIEGCSGNKMFDTVNVRGIPTSWFHIEHKTRSDTVLCMEDSVIFVADMGDSVNFKYEWNPQHFFHQNNKGTIWGRVETSSDISLTITDQFGCTETSVQHFDPQSCCSVHFPSAFTPNGDGRNDKFRPIQSGYHRFHVFRIQNRWGQTVYETTNSDGEWDGTYGGVPQDIGVYFFYLKMDCDGKTIEARGDVTLVR